MKGERIQSEVTYTIELTQTEANALRSIHGNFSSLGLKNHLKTAQLKGGVDFDDCQKASTDLWNLLLEIMV